MARYTVITASRVDSQLIRHIRFLSNVSLPVAKRFRKEYEEILDCLEENPFQYPVDTDPNLPEGMYRKALFSRWYKALFIVENKTVYLDAVVDCRQSAKAYEL
ncbi:MAG: type II toxin-antitoxin system RelE/ParE family toxin [Oscillospiraceae bacterium]|nr:type II toxin-antitoxin system RelE/ParE family toxin [Oscillospiraceae bacterium]